MSEEPKNEEPTSPEPKKVTKAGTVALVGRPNAGKSTLMNALLEEKLAIVSNKPQTTRHRLVGILTTERGQMVFYDTPGVHKPEHHMNRNMVKAAQEALNEADVVCLLVDASQPAGSGDRFMLDWVKPATSKRIVLLNKIDKVAKPALLPRIAEYAQTGIFEEIVPISALREDGLETVLDILWNLLPEGEPSYDAELLTVHPERFLVAERIREKILEQTGDELPFATAVILDSWEEKGDGLLVLQATILAEKDGQKKILVGSGGARIKAIGTAARLDLEDYLERRVFLELNVKLSKDWRENKRLLAQLENAPYEAKFGDD
jgi:GTP-binding protein Era